MSTAELAKVGPGADQYDSREIIETIKQTVCKGATDAQLKMFIQVCRATGLNPFLKEIWFVPSVGVMAGRDGYLRVANEHPMFDGMETLIDRDEKKVPIKATCRVWRKDRSHPITCEAFYNEYKKGGNVWQTYPSAMIGKVAEVLALKRSFSINGVVTEEEIGNQEPTGSREEQQATAEAIIERQREELKQLESGIVEGETENLPSGPPPVAELDPTMLKQFRTIKGTLGESEYYRILKAYGYTKSNQIPDRETGKTIYKSMKGYLNASEPFERLRQRDAARFDALLEAEGYNAINEIKFGGISAKDLQMRLELAMSVPQDELARLEQQDSETFWRIAGANGLDAESLKSASPATKAKLAELVKTEFSL